MISARGISGVASHCKHTRATELTCEKIGEHNFRMLGDPVYAYHKYATPKNDGS